MARNSFLFNSTTVHLRALASEMSLTELKESWHAPVPAGPTALIDAEQRFISARALLDASYTEGEERKLWPLAHQQTESPQFPRSDIVTFLDATFLLPVSLDTQPRLGQR